MKREHDIDFLIIIADRKKRKELLGAMEEIEGRLVNSIYGKSSVKASTFMDVFGFAREENKIIITFLISNKKTDKALEILMKRFGFDKPNTGIAFTLPVDGLLF